jgi:pimeloyl-ACP methyl ester carboxylesterase
VVRFDGIRKKGESYNDPACRIPGREYLHYVFSQVVDDVADVARYLKLSTEFGVSAVVLLTFSAAAIEARRALARDESGLFNVWISVAGSPDVQSMTGAISGGVDFASGSEREAKFGIQELLGVAVNIDEIGRDGDANNLLFIEHSRNDMASIHVPVTRYHGQFDAWVDLNRVIDILSHDQVSNRRLVLLPVGHQLKSSRQAYGIFQEIAREIARLVLRKAVQARRLKFPREMDTHLGL